MSKEESTRKPGDATGASRSASILRSGGRVIFGLPFAFFGVIHFAFTSHMAAMVPDWLPGPTLWVYLIGVILVATAAAVISNRLVRPAALTLAALLTSFVFFVHVPSLFDAASMQFSLNNLLKDLGLLGGALSIAGARK